MGEPSGPYESQIGEYAAFIPDPLPPKNFQIGPNLQRILSKADQAVGRLDGAVAIIPDADRFISMFVLREAVLSSQIEGTNASFADVLEWKAKVDERKKKNDKSDVADIDIKEVDNYVAAIDHGIELLKSLPLSSRLIKEVHAVLMNGVRGGELAKTPGEFRKSQNWIGGPTPSSATFVPPPWEIARASFGELEQFMSDTQRLPPLIAAGLIHAQFETIHPFLDGNGRTGRLLIVFWLISQGVLRVPVLCPSLYLKREQDEYVRRLTACREESAWEEWLAFFLDAVCESSIEAAKIALDIVGLNNEHSGLIANKFGKRTANAFALFRLLFASPIVNARFVEANLGISQPTASSLLNAFEDVGILRETTGGMRNKLYAYDRYLNLFPGIYDRS